MAEIRSTMDMVMERAAKMAAESNDNANSDNGSLKGMRLAAEYLKTDQGNIKDVLQQQDKEEQPAIRKGMTDALLRNIVLPRDEMLLESSAKALEAVAALASGQASSTCSELQQILNQYSQHKDQMVQQLNDAIRSQLEQQLTQQGTQLTEDMEINPAMHPKYQEELDKMMTDLNSQYNQALDQRKETIRQQIVPAK
ncbi:MAG: DUF6657 family protein [Desulfopila sp.]